MLIVLGISTLLASQAPRQQEGGGDQGTETQETQAADAGGGAGSEPAGTAPGGAADAAAKPGRAKGKQLPEGVPCGTGNSCATIDIDAERITVVTVDLGEQLGLTVRSPSATDLVEIPALGLIDSADPFKPANFDLLADRKGNFGIRLVEADRLIGRIEVRPQARGRSTRGEAGDRP